MTFNAELAHFGDAPADSHCYGGRVVVHTAGLMRPTASVAATREDVDHYLAVLEEFVGELAA
jgi:hypothetical protein